MTRFLAPWLAGLFALLSLGLLAGRHASRIHAGAAGLSPAAPRHTTRLETAATAAASPGMGSGPEAGTQLWLPMLNYVTGDDICEAWIDVQNVGATHGGAILVTWDEDEQDGSSDAEACASSCDGPLGVTCSGLLAPGTSWAFLGAQIPTGSASGTLLSVVDATLSELGGSATTPALAALCALLGGRELDQRGWLSSGGVQEDCAAWRSFQAAWREGGAWRDLPLGSLRGPALAARVHRKCPGTITPGVEAVSSYPAMPDAALANQDAAGAYRHMLLGARRDAGLGDTATSIQNVGEECALLRLWLVPNDACQRPTKTCADYRLEPGQSITLDLGTRGSAPSIAGCPEVIPFEGHVWIESDQPIATLSDHIAGNMLSSHVGVPWPAPAPPESADGESAWLGHLPLILGPSDRQSEIRLWVGVDSEADVVVEATLHVDGLPDPITRTLSLCGRSSAEAALYTSPLAETHAALLRVRVHAAAGSDPGAPLRATAMAEVLEAAPGFVPRSAYRTRLFGSAPRPAAVLALGGARYDLRGSGLLEELVIANVAQEATEIVIRFFDINGPTAHLCRTLAPGEVAWLDPQDRPRMALDAGFHGAVIAEALAWTDASLADEEGFALTGAVLTRNGTTANRDVPGDEVAFTAAVPLPVEEPAAPSPWPGADAAPPCPAPVEPHRGEPPSAPAEEALVWLPALYWPDRSQTCSHEIVVRNEAATPQIALLVDWIEPGFCPPMCMGFRAASCSPLLAPGGTWRPSASEVGETSRSAAVLGLSAQSMRELGLPPRNEVLAANLLCERLSGSAQTDQQGPCLAWPDFLATWRTGADYGGLPLARLVGGALAVSVTRECERPADSGTSITSRYEAPSGGRPAAAETWPERHVASVYPAYARAEASLPGQSRLHGLTSLIYLQNAGTVCTQVSIVFESAPPVAGGSCAPRTRCRLLSLAPGESYDLHASHCVGPSWHGFVTLISDQPLAVVAQVMGDDRDLSFPAAPWHDPFDLDRNGVRDAQDRAPLRAAAGAVPGDPRWRDWLDLWRDGAIDESDVDVLNRWLPGAGPPCPTATPPATPTPRTRRTATASPPPVTATPTASPPTARPALYVPWSGTGEP